jgi:hypothetical protein
MMSRSGHDSPGRELVNAAKNWHTIDGLWFLAVEARFGMENAIACDKEVWESFSVIEAKRIKERLGLPDDGGLDALEQALSHRLFSLVNEQRVVRVDPYTLEYYMVTCRTQSARDRKGLPKFPCREVGEVEHRSFAQAIDPRILVKCISCPPDPPVPGFCCGWRFVIPPETDPGI